MIDFNPSTNSYTKQGMPRAQDLYNVVLEAVANNPNASIGDLTNWIVRKINLPEHLATKQYHSGKDNRNKEYVIKKRVSWACTELKAANLLSKANRSTPYQLTETGLKMLQQGINVTKETLDSIPEFQLTSSTWKRHKQYDQQLLQQAHENKEKAKQTNVIPLQNKVINKKDNTINNSDFNKRQATMQTISANDDNNAKKAIQIDQIIEDKEQLVEMKLLNKLYNIDPYRLEKAMTTLLSNMGYKGLNGQAVTTQKSNDGGIDGIINQDALGLNTIYLQVKRYAKNNAVSRPEIDAFVGALKREHASRGVFITTSSFTSGAYDAGRESNIALIDGELLAKLMVRYHVGVQVKHVYTVYQIDNDFFENDLN